jgi:hypothetical protein
MKKILSIGNAIVAILAGGLVLLGYLLPGLLGGLRSQLVQWAIILAAFALLLGIFNLASVHWKRVVTPNGGLNNLYSAVLLLSLVLTILLVSISGPTSFWSIWLVNTFQVPVEASLMAVLAVVLVFAAARLLSRRMHWTSLLFLGVVVLVLLGTAPLLFIGEVSILSSLRQWLAGVPALAGARGLLLGVALGTIAAGLRILMGVDRPYGD